MLLTKVITEKEIRSNIDKGAYLDKPIAALGNQLCFTPYTFNKFQKDIVEFLKVTYLFNTEQSEIIFNRCWLDCSAFGILNVLEDVIDTASFTLEMISLSK